jgi:hypothetical protein
MNKPYLAGITAKQNGTTTMMDLEDFMMHNNKQHHGHTIRILLVD